MAEQPNLRSSRPRDLRSCFVFLPHQGQDRLRGQTQLVGNRDADATSSEIEAQKAGLHSRDGNPETDRKPHLRMG